MNMKTKKLPKGKDKDALAKCEELGITIKETKQIERPGKIEGELLVENLITINLPDGSTLTVNADDPDHTAKIEKVTNRINSDIEAGKRTRVA